MNPIEKLRMPQWYKKLASHCFPTEFVSLEKEEVKALIAGETEGDIVRAVQKRLKEAMHKFSGGRFISVDTVAPTDTERFEAKHGKTFSAESAWNVLCASAKVKAAAEAGLVSTICVRPYRHMQPAREFRLFVKEGKLAGMSQYWLIRHFARLPDRQEKYWKKADHLISAIAEQLPMKDIVVDIYITSGGDILILDLNPWGEPTAPLMYNDWNRDWTQPGKCEIIPPPHKVSGEVEVHF